MAWENSFKIDIDSSKIDSDLSDFPILLYISASSGLTSTDVSAVFDELGANSKKIKVTTDADGNSQCYVEIERWDETNEEAWLWVKIPTITSGSDTTIYFWYDSTEADNTSYVGDIDSTPGHNVWDSDFLCVCHFEQAPGSAQKDSTSNGNDITTYNFDGDESEDGLVGKVIHFNGSDEYMDGSVGSLNAPFTVEIMVYYDQLEQAGGDYDYTFEFESDAFTHSRKASDEVYYNYASKYLNGSVITGQEWTYLGGTSDTSSTYIELRKNGAADALDDDVASAVNVGGGFELGRYSGGSHYLDGKYCELRISQVKRSDAWMDATNDTLRDNLLTWTAVNVGGDVITSTPFILTNSLEGVPTVLIPVVAFNETSSLDTPTIFVGVPVTAASFTLTDTLESPTIISGIDFDFTLDLRAVLEHLEDLTFDLRISKQRLLDMLLDLRITDGVHLEDLPLDLRITDAEVLQDLTLDLRLIKLAPSFSTYISHRLSSVLKDTGL